MNLLFLETNHGLFLISTRSIIWFSKFFKKFSMVHGSWWLCHWLGGQTMRSLQSAPEVGNLSTTKMVVDTMVRGVKVTIWHMTTLTQWMRVVQEKLHAMVNFMVLKMIRTALIKLRNSPWKAAVGSQHRFSLLDEVISSDISVFHQIMIDSPLKPVGSFFADRNGLTNTHQETPHYDGVMSRCPWWYKLFLDVTLCREAF